MLLTRSSYRALGRTKRFGIALRIVHIQDQVEDLQRRHSRSVSNLRGDHQHTHLLCCDGVGQVFWT